MNYRETMSRLNAMLNTIDSAYAAIAKKHGLTFNALMVICLIDEADTITQKQICDALHLPKSTVHSILLDLIKQDQAVLSAGSNKKEKLIEFTEAGKQYFAKILIETERFENKILAALGDDTCAFLIEITENLGEIISKEISEITGSEVIG